MAAAAAAPQASPRLPAQLRSALLAGDAARLRELGAAACERLRAADLPRLAGVARAFADSRVRDERVLGALAARAAALDGAVLAGPSAAAQAASLLDSLGKLAARGLASSAPRGGPGAPLAEAARGGAFPGRGEAAAHLDARVAACAEDLSLLDLSRALGGLARLGPRGPLRLLPAARRRLEAAARTPASELDPRHLCALTAAYATCARSGHRDPEAVRALGELLTACGLHGRRVPARYLLPLLRALSTQLRPAPATFARAVEAGLQRDEVAALGAHELAVLLRALASIPGLPRGGLLARTVCDAALQAPLSALPPEGLVGAMRCAWALGHVDPGFWVPVLRQATRALADPPGAGGWATGDLAAAALLASRVIAAAGAERPAFRPGADDGSRPLLAAAPAAADLLRAAAGAAGARAAELAPCDVAVVATAHARAALEDGPLFAVVSHRACELLGGEAGGGPRFNGVDVAQLLAALARFGYRDEELLSRLGAKAEVELPSYGARARDIALWALSELGGVPGAERHPALSEALVEYELARGRCTDRTREHLLSVEVAPVDDCGDDAALWRGGSSEAAAQPV
ncbi:unnamed protein product [Prorocentrum cordatum]|uniref:Uncharacterized protein n=1 Tax=Prorocentrum cordatum TaxID=2364126 RepID=A0ABN9VGU8_9DINO|nr:unnamed protein product [Polarella glacialis]